MSWIEMFFIIGLAVVIIGVIIIAVLCYLDYRDAKYYKLHPEKRREDNDD